MTADTLQMNNSATIVTMNHPGVRVIRCTAWYDSVTEADTYDLRLNTIRVVLAYVQLLLLLL